MIYVFLYGCILITLIYSPGCKKASYEHIIIDNESQAFMIGEQVWSTKNLKITHFVNGDSISQAQNTKAWEIAGKNNQPAWCYSEGDTNQILYNWYAVHDKRGLIPKGWHLPSYEEIKYVMKIQHVLNNITLEDYDYGEAYASFPKSTSANDHIIQTTYFMPLTYAGNRFGDGKFRGTHKIGVFWTSEQPEKVSGYIPVYAQLAEKKEVYTISSNPANGIAIRLIKD